MDYGMDVKWEAHEIAAFRIYNAMCAKQARAVYDAKVNGTAKPVIVPALVMAANARAQVAA